MALVAYSDSEGSDNEAPAPAPVRTTKSSVKPSLFAKPESRKIKVELPSLQPEKPATEDGTGEQPPAKRARTAGAFGGFNSLLPAPKRAAAPTALGKGVSLKTSSEAAFSRAPPPVIEKDEADGDYDEYGNKTQSTAPQSRSTNADASPDIRTTGSEEVKIVGKATRFRPLSVANGKKKKPVKKSVMPANDVVKPVETAQSASGPTSDAVETAAPLPKPKKSLFSGQQEQVPDEFAEVEEASDISVAEEAVPVGSVGAAASTPAANTLESVTADMNLTAAERRQLFGRHAKNGAANISHFNLDAEYRLNEELRQSGESVQHKAVKAVAPGKHSLQQLVNNAKSNQESIEDKWAEGRRNRGEGASKYGWGKG